jgi:type VI secretion system protein
MRAASLLSRIRQPELAAKLRTATDREIRESVLQHLRMMCTTRQGTMLTAPDFGVCDVSEMVHSFPDAIAMMARSIRHTIQTYEPRLANVQVRHVPTETIELLVRYEVTATLVSGGSKTPVKFETSLDATRKISIR